MATVAINKTGVPTPVVMAIDEIPPMRSPTRKISEPYRYLQIDDSETEVQFAAIQQVLSDDDTSYRHRHNFQQIRFMISGEMRLGKDIVARPGDCVYFPESVMYGPTNYNAGYMFLLQWRGPSPGSFYLPYDDVTAVIKEMRELGGQIDFDRGGVWRYPDGRLEDVAEAASSHHLGKPLEYAAPRFGDVLCLRSAAYEACPVTNGVNVGVKHLAYLNETGPNIKVLDFDANASLGGAISQSQQIWMIFQGELNYEGKKYPSRSLLYFPPGAHRQPVGSAAGAKVLVVQLAKQKMPPIPFTEF
jgi:hypothetical protein